MTVPSLTSARVTSDLPRTDIRSGSPDIIMRFGYTEILGALFAACSIYLRQGDFNFDAGYDAMEIRERH